MTMLLLNVAAFQSVSGDAVTENGSYQKRSPE